MSKETEFDKLGFAVDLEKMHEEIENEAKIAIEAVIERVVRQHLLQSDGGQYLSVDDEVGIGLSLDINIPVRHIVGGRLLWWRHDWKGDDAK